MPLFVIFDYLKLHKGNSNHESDLKKLNNVFQMETFNGDLQFYY